VEDRYLYHLQHTAGLEPEAAAEITALLEGGTITNFEVTCFTEQLHAVGFISPKASFLDLGRQDAE
jgi:hypothetical protein